MQLLWLASWYPNPREPQNGDFVQRHAQAVAGFLPLTVIYVSQYQPGEAVQEHREWRITGQLTELILRFAFRPLGHPLIDKLRFNLAYFREYRSLIRQTFAEQGRPALVHVHVPIKAGMIARWIRKVYGIPYLLSEHSGHYQPESADYEFDRPARYLRNLRRVVRDAAVVTTVSSRLAGIMQQMFRIPAVKVIPNTVNTDFFHPPHGESDPGPFRFLHVSAMDPNKRVDRILDAFAEVLGTGRKASLQLTGTPPQHLLQRIALEPFNDSVIVTGEVSYPEVAAAMQQADAFILFSGFENQPCVILESLCCGLQVISADVGGVSALLQPGDGELLPAGDTQSLVNAMIRHIDRGRQAMTEQRARAARAQERFNYRSVGMHFLELYRPYGLSPITAKFVTDQT